MTGSCVGYADSPPDPRLRRQDTISDTPAPSPFSWGQYVDLLLSERGGLSELARSLAERAPRGSLAEDPGTIERGIRRLRNRGSAPGEKYGRLLMRVFGLPSSVAAHVRALGQYHSRLADLPAGARRDQLSLWDRPPVSESASAAWVHLAAASVAMRDLDAEGLARRMELARMGLAGADPAASVEWRLLDARLLSDRGDFEACRSRLDEAGGLLTAIPDPEDRACYLARLQDQRAFQAAKGWRERPDRLRDALGLYLAIPISEVPFANFRRAHGEAWCRWRLGDHAIALRAAEAAARAAGDGGLLRMRAMALELQARILEDGGLDASGPRDRARAIAGRLGDRLLLLQSAPSPG